VRRGRSVAGAGGIAVLVQAAEAVTPETLIELRQISRCDPAVAVTARRGDLRRHRIGGTSSGRFSKKWSENLDCFGLTG